MSPKFHIRRGDLVEVISGKEKGKRGKIISVLTKRSRVIVEKVNLVKRHVRPSEKYPTGGIIEKEASIHISNVMIVCPKCDKPVRTGKKLLQDRRKVRCCKKCGEVIEE